MVSDGIRAVLESAKIPKMVRVAQTLYNVAGTKQKKEQVPMKLTSASFQTSEGPMYFSCKSALSASCCIEVILETAGRSESRHAREVHGTLICLEGR